MHTGTLAALVALNDCWQVLCVAGGRPRVPTQTALIS